MGYLNTVLAKRASFFDFDDYMTKDAIDYSTWNPQAMNKVENMVMRAHGLNPAAARQYVQRSFMDKGFTPADVRGYTQQMHLEKNVPPRTTPRPATPAPAAPAAAPAPANAPISPNPATPAAAANAADDAARAATGTADDAAKAALKSKGGPIGYGRRIQAIAHRATHNPIRAGKQGWQLAKTFARRNPKLAALMAIGGTLAGGSLMAGAANSGRPPVRQSDATNPYAGLETY